MLFFLLFGCRYNYKNDCELCNKITFDDLNYKINNNDTFVIIIKNNNCSLCKEYNYNIDKYLQNSTVDIFSIESSLLDLSNSKIKNFINEIKEKAGINDNAILPATLFYLDGNLINVEIGVLSYKELSNNIDFLFSLK